MPVVSIHVNKIGSGQLRVGVSIARPPRPGPSSFQAGHIPSQRESCERDALSPVAAACRRSLPLLSAAAASRACRAAASLVISRLMCREEDELQLGRSEPGVPFPMTTGE